MSRTLSLLASILVILVAYLFFHHYSSELTPASSSSTNPASTKNSTVSDEKQKDSNFGEWREFSFKPEHFKVLLPSPPQHVSDTVMDPKTQEPRKYETFATASDNGSAFMINAITYTTLSEADASEESLKAVVHDMMERNKSNKLNEMKMGSFHGLPALDFSLSNGDLMIQGKVVAHLKSIYILSMINKKEMFNQKELDFFINSFDFIDEKDIQEKAKTTKQIK